MRPIIPKEFQGQLTPLEIQLIRLYETQRKRAREAAKAKIELSHFQRGL